VELYLCIFFERQVCGSDHLQRSVNLDDLDQALNLIADHSHSIVGVGETGLDFTPRFIKSDGDKEEQRKVFRRQVLFSIATFLSSDRN